MISLNCKRIGGANSGNHFNELLKYKYIFVHMASSDI